MGSCLPGFHPTKEGWWADDGTGRAEGALPVWMRSWSQRSVGGSWGGPTSQVTGGWKTQHLGRGAQVDSQIPRRFPHIGSTASPTSRWVWCVISHPANSSCPGVAEVSSALRFEARKKCLIRMVLKNIYCLVVGIVIANSRDSAMYWRPSY